MEKKYYNHNQRTGEQWEVTEKEYISYRETWQIDKYYYPDIEDLRIGWEGEVNWARGYSEEFEKEVIRLKDDDGIYLGDLEEATQAMDDGYAQFRVPLFSKDQLEREPGWYNVKEILGEIWDFSGQFNGTCGTIFKILYHRATFEPNSLLEVWDTNFEFRLYHGQCQDINDFRWICKMLRIR